LHFINSISIVLEKKGEIMLPVSVTSSLGLSPEYQPFKIDRGTSPISGMTTVPTAKLEELITKNVQLSGTISELRSENTALVDVCEILGKGMAEMANRVNDLEGQLKSLEGRVSKAPSS
jgi:hypothetical protein